MNDSRVHSDRDSGAADKVFTGAIPVKIRKITQGACLSPCAGTLKAFSSVSTWAAVREGDVHRPPGGMSLVSSGSRGVMRKGGGGRFRATPLLDGAAGCSLFCCTPSIGGDNASSASRQSRGVNGSDCKTWSKPFGGCKN